MPSVIRSYSDDSAPVMIGNQKGSLIALLKAVLVNGYTGSPALGWEIAFEDTLNFVCVFRPGTGNIRPFIRIDESLSTTGVQYAEVTCYETMSDIDTGISPCPSDDSGLYNHIVKAVGNYSTSMYWTIIGDSSGFWLLTQPTHNTGTSVAPTLNGHLHYPIYLGAYNAYDHTNKFNFISQLNHNNSYNYFQVNSSPNTTFIMRDPFTKEIGSVKAQMNLRFSGSTGLMGTAYPGQGKMNGRFIYEPIGIYYNSRYDIGILPGVFAPVSGSEEGAAAGNLKTTELPAFWDNLDVNRKLYVATVRVTSNQYSAYVSRVGFLVGEGFRSVY